MADFLADNETLFRYFHILAGITWIGLLYFFNLVNLPLLKFSMKKPFDADMGEKVTASIAIKTLWWFRYGALFTVLFGLILIEIRRKAFDGSIGDYFFQNGAGGLMILMGILLGLAMAINVWFIIWPAQQTILSNNKKISAGEGDKDALAAENGPLLKNAVMASRANTWMSIPMLFGMVFGAHGGQYDGLGDMTGPLAVLAIVLVIMVVMSKNQK